VGFDGGTGWKECQAALGGFYSVSLVQPARIKQSASSSDISTMRSSAIVMRRPEKVCTAPIPGGVLRPISLALLATLVLLFGFQGEQIVRQPLIIALLAVPIITQVYLNAGIAYAINRALGVPHNVACPSARDSGSPRVVGSTSASRSRIKVGSLETVVLRPAPRGQDDWGRWHWHAQPSQESNSVPYQDHAAP
jgi:hypothetical protein